MSPTNIKQMKNNYSILVALFIVGSTFAQAPEQMSYQAIVRDATGNLVTNQQVGMQISILQTTATGTAVYVETHTETTNANGLLTLQVGAGSVQNGTFASIDWSAGPYFVKAETDPAGGTTYTITGTQQLMSVPYALYAETSGASSSLWTQSGTDVVYTAGDALINGLTVGRGAGNIASNTANGYAALFSNTFGIYNTATGNGALISNTEGDGNTANGTLALFSNTDGSYNTANGSRALFSNTTGSNNTAIGYAADVTSGSLVNATAIGFDAKVNADNKIQLGDINVTSVATSGALTTGTVTYPIVNGTVGQVLTTDGAGAATWSDASSSLWTQSGTDVVYTAGDAQINGLTVGRGAGNIAYNTATGNGALFSNTSGTTSTANGYVALYSNTTGSYNTANGYAALYLNTDGSSNIANGWAALYYNTSGNQNIANGNRALFSNTTGSNNTAIGYAADVTSGSLVNATAIGFDAKVNADNKIQLGDINVTSVATSGALTTGTVTYPIVNGTVGQVLTTDGAGAATWSDAGAGAGPIGPIGPTGPTGPTGPSGANGQGGVSTAGSGINVTGAGTVASPYVVSTTSSACGLSIGNTYQGGIIFYLEPSGCHGLIAAPTDQSMGAQFGGLIDGSFIDYKAYGSGLFEGKYNTSMINFIQGGSTSAAAICGNLSLGVYSDWYLPSIEELNKMYQNIGQGQGNPSLFNVGGFAYSFYWSSTEHDKNNVWRESFNIGYQYYHPKDGTNHVRAVRAF